VDTSLAWDAVKRNEKASAVNAPVGLLFPS
jgi:hypothetical protein